MSRQMERGVQIMRSIPGQGLLTLVKRRVLSLLRPVTAVLRPALSETPEL
jgi:hypothetical protein